MLTSCSRRAVHALFGSLGLRILPWRPCRSFDLRAIPSTEEHMEKPFLRRWGTEGNDFNGYTPRSSSVTEDRASPFHRRLAFHRLLERGAHVAEQVLANHAQEIEAGRASRLFKIGACPSPKFQHAQVRVDSHPARTQAPEQDAVAGLAHIWRIRRARRCRIASLLGCGRAH